MLQFVVECGFSHAAPDDPIVHPGHPGRSHLHTFGNTAAGAASTAASLAATGGTTCDQQLDRAAYWAPALLDGGQPVAPTGAVAYYRPGVGIDPATVDPYPFGLAMLAGDPVADEAQPLDVVAWSCGTGSGAVGHPAGVPGGSPHAPGRRLPGLLGRPPPGQPRPPGPPPAARPASARPATRCRYPSWSSPSRTRSPAAATT